MFLHSISMGMGVGEKEGEVRLTEQKCKVLVCQLSMGHTNKDFICRL